MFALLLPRGWVATLALPLAAVLVSAQPPFTSIFNLDPNFVPTSIPVTREYWFNIGTVVGAPDGVSRQMSVVNGMFPGPLIEVNEGDTVVVHVTNQLSEGQGLHWHGIVQNGSVYMDGVPGFTQCPIPPGKTFTYKFTIENQYGTYWWHSHFGNTVADGIAGGFIVHSPHDPLKRGEHFDEERILYVTDWLHDQSDLVVNSLLTKKGYRGSIAAPRADAILTNGIGAANCSSSFLPPGTPCATPEPAEVVVPVNKRIRFRIINMASHENYVISIDGHVLEVVEADATPVYGPVVTQVQLAPAQRYSIIVNTTQGKAGDTFWLRTATDIGCLGANSAHNINLAIIRYEDPAGNSTSTTPVSTAWPAFDAATTQCASLDELYTLTPRDPGDLLTEVTQTHVLSSLFGTFNNINGQPFFGFGFNNVTFKNQIYYPLLAQIQDAHPFNDSVVAHATFENSGVGDIIINNLDAGITHPFHLHGRAFNIVGRGKGNITAGDVASLALNTTNPPRRDTLQIAARSWAILRLITDTPGVWGLHCHIGWHLAQGKLAAIVIQPEVVKSSPAPKDWLQLCDGFDRGGFGPARRENRRSRLVFSSTDEP